MLGLDSPLDRELAATIFPDEWAQSKRDVTLTLRGFADDIRQSIGDSKADLSWIKLARFGEERTKRGKCYRNNANMGDIDGVEVDYDGEEISIEEAERVFRKAGVAALLYESASSTHEKPRWRAMCPCSRSHPPEARTAFVERLNGLFRGELDQQASFTLSQAFYYGNVRDTRPRKVRLVEGRAIDEAHDLKRLPKRTRETDGEREPDVSNSAAADRKAIQLILDGKPIEDFEEWAVDNPWKDYDRDSDYAIQKTWKHARGVAAKIALEERLAGSGFDYIGEPAKGQDSGKRSTLRVHYVSDLKSLPPFKHLIRDTISIGALSALIGTPGVGKTFVALDMLLHIATGKPWFGKAVVRGAVIMVALEGARGMWKRIRAWCERHGVDPDTLPIVVIDGSLNLRKDKTARQDIIDAARELSERTGLPVRAIVIDTLNRAMFGGNESASEDMGALIAGADHIRIATGANLMLVHHLGKDDTRGARGHSSLFGAVDTELTVEEKGKLKISKQKEGEDGTRFTFRLDQVDLGNDDEGNPVTSQVVVPDSRLTFDEEEGMSEHEKAALQTLRRMIFAANAIDGERDVALNEFRARIENSLFREKRDSARRMAWKRLIESPKFLEHIDIDGERIKCAQ